MASTRTSSRGVVALARAFAAASPSYRRRLCGVYSKSRVFRGHQGIREYFVTLEEAFDDLRLEAEEVIDAGGDRVVLLVWVSGRGEGSVIPVRHRYGRCGPCPLERSDSYLDPAEAIEAAGLSE